MSIDLSSVSYPFDRTGLAVTNKILVERHTLTSVNWTEFNIIIPKSAPFYSESITHLIHRPSGRRLERGVDWCEGWYYQSASGEIGLDIHCCIYFYDPALTGEVEIPSYQAMGGEWQINGQKLTEILAQVLLNPLRYYWEQVANLPEIFNPLDHDQDIQDFTRLGDLIDVLQNIAEALGATDETGLNGHLLDFNNPHKLTKEQVLLGKVMNYAMATTSDINIPYNPASYMSPVTTNQMISNIALAALNLHTQNVNNPHGTTADQTGAYFIEETDAILESLAAGLVHNLYAYRLEGKSVSEIVALAQSNSSGPVETLRQQVLLLEAAIDLHRQDIDNPHSVTADQVGSYTTGETDQLLTALAGGDVLPLYAFRLEGKGVLDIVEMANSSGSSAINAVAADVAALEASVALHTQNVNNPHSVTADQTGAYSTTETDALLLALANGTLHNVNSFRLEGKSVAEIVAMSTASTGGDLSALTAAVAALQSSTALHEQNVNNPHSVTADQTGAYSTEETDALLLALANGTLHQLKAALLEGKTVDDIVALSAAATSGDLSTLSTSVTALENALLLHSQSIDNPHAVTADQTGAYSTEETDMLLLALANGTLHSVEATTLEGKGVVDIVALAKSETLTQADGQYAAKSEIAPINEAIQALVIVDSGFDQRISALEAPQSITYRNVVVVPAGSVLEIDMHLMVADEATRSQYDYLGSFISVLLQDADPLSPTVDDFINSEAVITRAIRDERYLALHNHDTVEATLFVRIGLSKL